MLINERSFPDNGCPSGQLAKESRMYRSYKSVLEGESKKIREEGRVGGDKKGKKTTTLRD